MRFQTWLASVLAFSALSSIGAIINSLRLDLVASDIDSLNHQRLKVSNGTTIAETYLTNQSDGGTPRHQFPQFNDSGVVLFYHLAKTGGVTIEQHFNKLNHLEYVRVWDEPGFNEVCKDIDAILTGEKKQVLFVEMHGGEPKTSLPGIIELHPLIQTWRTLSQHSNVPFFSFTMLREPVSIHTSAFLFFHRRRCSASWCSKKRKFSPRQENIEKSATPNRQCMTLARGQHHEDYWINTGSKPVTEQECLQVEMLLRQDWNWVGRTENMSDTTLPMLMNMLYYHTDKSGLTNVESFNVHHKPKSPTIDPQKLGNKTKQALLELSVLDTKLYDSFHGE